MENASKALIIAGAILISILLITIGIILIQSGNAITEQGTSSMNSQTIQTFNSQFTPYQGTITGSQLRSLLSAVRANNVTDKGHQVAVVVDSTGTTFAEANIIATAHYKVSVTQASATASNNTLTEAANLRLVDTTTVTTEEGYIYKITVKK